MKLHQKTLLLFFILFSALSTDAQRIFPVAVTSDGLLLGKYKSANDATNPIPDTISLNEARNIAAINGIYIDDQEHLQKVEISDFQLKIVGKGDEITVLNKGQILTDESKHQLGQIKSGSKLFFEGINAKFPIDELIPVIILAFIVI